MTRDLRHGNRVRAVGLVIAGFTNAFQALVAEGAEKELRQAGLQLFIGSTDDDPGREPELARAMIDRRVSALMMMPDGDERGYLRAEHTFGTPVVLVGRPANGLECDVVMTDDDRAVDEATDQLLGLGHQRIAVLAGRASSFRAGQRLAGFRTALARHGVAEHPDLVTTGLGISAITRDPQEIGRQAALLAMERIARPDGRPHTVTLPSVLVRRGSGELPPVRGMPRGTSQTKVVTISADAGAERDAR
ncbi:LacI family DNA-binding transcriptional regulator [Nonomuraea sp. NPDC049480]|uniref:LacI family DNA-binding transcriptional regulator n=1 Tax=Nonomuraea sp. NPDC049480 TaxID=3364353 RepID=UPI003795CBC8